MAEPAQQLPPEDRSLAESLQKSEFERARMSAKRSIKTPSSNQKSTETNTSPFSNNTTNISPSTESSDGQAAENITNKPRTEREATQAAIADQKQKREQALGDVKKFREKHDARKDQQGSFKNALDRARLKGKQRKLAHADKQLKSLQKLQKMQEGSAWLLRFAWLNIIPTWGATSLYIMFHYMMAYLTPLSIIFVKFGDEWVPASIKRASPEAAKTVGKGLEIPETGCCIGAGCCFLMLIGIIVILIAVIAYVYLNPYDALIKAFPHMSWRALKCIGGVIFGVSTGGGC